MNNKHNLYWLCALILVTAFSLRMAQPDLVEFKRDEATVARLGQAIAYEGYRPAVGVDSSVGIDNLPFTLYLMAFALRINPDPLSAVVFTTFLNASAVILCYWLTYRTFGPVAALLSVTLFAVNPWAVLYARKIWCRTMPLFTMSFMISNIAVFVWGKRWALIGAFVSLAALIGLQLEGIAFIPIFLLALLMYRDKVSWPPLVIGVVLCAMFFLPYLIFDAGQNWSNLRGLLAYSGGTGQFSWDAIRYAFSLTGANGIDGHAGALNKQFRSSIPNLWFGNSIAAFTMGAALIYAGFHAFKAKAQERRRLFTLLLLWFIIPTLLQLRPSASTQRHYFVLHYPVQFILIGVFIVDGVAWLGSKIKQSLPQGEKIYQIFVIFQIVVTLVWTIWQITVTLLLRSYMVNHPTTGGYGIPLRYTRRAALEATKLAKDAEIIVVSDSTRPMMTEAPTVFDALLFGQAHRFVDGRGVMLYPASDRVVYLVDLIRTGSQYSSLVTNLAGLPSVTKGSEIQMPDGRAFRTYLRVASDTFDVSSSLNPLAEGIPFANNVVFSGYQVDGTLQPGEYLKVWLGWWLHGPPSIDEDYHFTVQLQQVADTGLQVISQDDHVAFPSDYWRGGDMALSYFLVPIPLHLSPGAYTLNAGMYSYPDIVSVPIINSTGKSVGDSVQLTEYFYED